jgi:hypothetical protein
VKRFVRRHRSGALLAGGAVVAVLAAAGVSAFTLANAAEQSGIPANAVRAAAFSEQSGVQTEGTADAGGGKNVGWLANGDWMKFSAVDLGAAGSLTTSLRIAAAYADRPGIVEVHLASQSGPVVASIPVTATGGWQKWVTRTDTQQSPGGKQDVFLVLRSDQGGDFVNVNWFAFSGTGTSGPASPSHGHSATAGPTPTATGKPGTSQPPMSMAPPAPGQWVPVDRAKWDAQVARYKAQVPAPKPATGRSISEFQASCQFSHEKADDPIVFFGQPGRSHNHSFLGNNSTNASTTTEDLMKFTASSCTPIQDHSAYWIPTLFENDKPVYPKGVTVYYGSEQTGNWQNVMPMPNGLRMILGDATKQVMQNPNAGGNFWCVHGPTTGVTRSDDNQWPVCQALQANETDNYHFTMKFPDCWDGKNLDSPNHKDHVTNGFNNSCPATHPVQIPKLTFEIAYPTIGTKNGMRLASGLPSSMHADAFIAWDEAKMNWLTLNCAALKHACNGKGEFEV